MSHVGYSPELGWYNCTGTSMSDEQWSDPIMHAIAVYLDGTDAPDDADDGTPLLDDDFLILVNGYWDEVTLTLPRWVSHPGHGSWNWTATTRRSPPPASSPSTGDTVVARPRSVQVLRAPRSEGSAERNRAPRHPHI